MAHPQMMELVTATAGSASRPAKARSVVTHRGPLASPRRAAALARRSVPRVASARLVASAPQVAPDIVTARIWVAFREWFMRRRRKRASWRTAFSMRVFWTVTALRAAPAASYPKSLALCTVASFSGAMVFPSARRALGVLANTWVFPVCISQPEAAIAIIQARAASASDLAIPPVRPTFSR